MPNRIIYLAISALLLCAFPLPYIFSTIVRTIACATFIWGAVVSKNKKISAHIWLFAILAIVCNPILPLFFPKHIWFFINLIVAIMLYVFRDKIQEK